MARAFLVFISTLLFALPLWSGGCGSATGGSEFGNPALTGTLPVDEPTALQASKGQTAGCGGGLASVRTVCGGKTAEFDVADDCSFSVTLAPNVYCYVQFLDAGGHIGALLSWQDPTALNDGTSLKLTSFLKMAKDQTHGLGAITLLNPAGFASDLASRGISFNGANGATIAFPDVEPVGFDTNGNGIPDDNEAGFQTGSDTDGDGIPEISSEVGCTLPAGAGPLHGRLRLTAIRDDLTAAELAEINKDPSIVPSNITLSGNDFATDPFPARGAWITLGDKKDTSLSVMADDQGNFTIPSVPAGVVTAKVYKDLTQDEPVLHLPLCLLQTNVAAVTDAIAITQKVPFPDPCTMDDTSEGQCGGVPLTDTSDAPLTVALGLVEPKETHIVCGSSNASGCCLDYNGSYWPASGRPHNFARHAAAYFGSTCEQYVDINCCVNERGTVKNLVLATAGLKNLVSCWVNHKQRNCQNIDIQPSALVLSASPSVCVARDPSTNPETITVACGSRTPLCHHNNACVNHDTITLQGCGTLDPVGVLEHDVIDDIHQTERILTYTAPSSPCSAVVTSTAWGFTRSLNINVVCSGTGTGGTGTTTTPFTPAIGRTFTSTDTGCGLGSSTTVKSADANEVILEPFGANGATEFTPESDAPDTADSVSKNLNILGAPGHSCSVNISETLHMQVSCVNSGAGSCEQGFDAE